MYEGPLIHKFFIAGLLSVLAGPAYAYVIRKMFRSGKTGYTHWSVVIGVLFVLSIALISGLIDLQTAIRLLFVFSTFGIFLWAEYELRKWSRKPTKKFNRSSQR